MKFGSLVLLTFTYVCFPHLQSFSQANRPDVRYRRSSLYTLMIDDEGRKYAQTIKSAFVNCPIPDKFNDHCLVKRTIPGVANGKDQMANIDRFVNTNDIARLVVARWFNRSEAGAFDMNLISERGSYNASTMEAFVAKSSARGLAQLSDAGEELIGNTFVLVNDFRYISKEEIASATRTGLSILNAVAYSAGYDIQNATTLASAGVTVAGKGYVVKTTSTLYRLVWNDSIAAVFYNDYWMDTTHIDDSRKRAFEHSDIFKLKLVGTEVAWADVQSSIFTSKSEEELVKVATIKSVDEVIVKLQKAYPEFKTKTPLYSVDPLSVKIGLKEGLRPRDKFIVLEQNQDENGKTYYKKVGKIKVDKKQIWDNRFNAADSMGVSGKVDRTLFKGGKNYYPGMLIIQK